MCKEKYFTPAELAEDWQCCLETVYDLLRAGKLRGFKLGHSWRVTETARYEYENAAGVPEPAKPKLPKRTAPILRLT